MERILRLGIDPSKAVRGGKQFEAAAGGATRSAATLAGSVLRTSAVIGGVGTALVGASAALGRFAQAGGQQLTVQAAFASRVGDTEVALSSLRDATSGLVDDYRLMVQANTAFTLGAADTTAEMALLAEGATKMGRALGLDTAFALESLISGLARGEKEILDNLGLVVSQADANRKYADALGIAESALTDVQRKEAFREEGMRQLREQTSLLGEETLNAGDAYTQLTVEIKNAVDEMKLLAAESDSVTEFFQEWRMILRDVRGGPSAGGQGIIAGLEGIDDLDALRQRYEMFADMFPSVQMQAGKSIDEINESFKELGITGQDIGHILAAIEDRMAELAVGAGDAAPEVRNLLDVLKEFEAVNIPSIPGFDRNDPAYNPGAARGALMDRARGSFAEGLQATVRDWQQSGGPGFTDPDARAGIVQDALSETDEALMNVAGAARIAGPLLGDLGIDLNGVVAGIAQGGALGAGMAAFSLLGGVMEDLFASGVEAQYAARAWEDALDAFANAFDSPTELEAGMAAAEAEFNRLLREQGIYAESVEAARRALAGYSDEGIEADPTGRLRALRDILAAYDEHLAGLQDLLREQETDFGEDLRVRMLRAQGLDDEAAALQLAIKHERELQEAREMGYSDETLAYLEQVQAQEALAQARQDELDAINAVTQALNAPQGLNLALMTYRASLDGSRPTRDGGITSGGFVEPNRRRGGDYVIQTMTINVTGSGSPRETARAVRQEFEREARLGGTSPYEVVDR